VRAISQFLAGSLWTMANHNMMPIDQLMQMQRQNFCSFVIRCSPQIVRAGL
jgi:hypothetical protein